MIGTRTAFATLALIAASASARAAVTISTAATQNMSCSAGVCSPTASDAVLNVSDLENLLATGNVDVQTTGPHLEAKDIVVQTPVAWSSSSALSFYAWRSIAINGSVSVGGLSAVELMTDNGGSGGVLSFGPHGSVQFANLSSVLIINGTAFTLVDTVQSLASAIAANDGKGYFAFANSYDASGDGTYTSSPIQQFDGVLEGLGNAISNLTIATTSSAGLFAETEYASLSDIGLVNVAVTGGSGYRQKYFVSVGALVAVANETSITNAYANGYVTGGDSSEVGGLIGSVTYSGTVISSSRSAGSVRGGKHSRTGGLLGYYGTVDQSFSRAKVSGGAGSSVGGLLGSSGLVYESSATGNVKGGPKAWVGGLIGSYGDIQLSFASGAVSGGNYSSVGGAGGYEIGIIESYATGAVSGGQNAFVGGLSGTNIDSGITQGYSTGTVTGGAGAYVGGLVGADYASTGSIETSYWDTDSSGITNLAQGAGNVANDPGITGLTTLQFQSGLPFGFDPYVWNETSAINNGLPYLINNPPPK